MVSAVLNDARDLAISTDVNDQLRLLKSLGHWVGDIHQPMHVSFEDDRGGNLVVIEGPYRYNLHAVWDNCIIEKKIGIDHMHVAQELRAEITGADRTNWIPSEINIDSVVSWANESFAITTRPDVQYCMQKEDACWYADDQKEYRGGAQRVVTVDDAYLAAQAATVREQFKKGWCSARGDPQCCAHVALTVVCAGKSMLIRAATEEDANGIWSVIEPAIRAGETYALPRDMTKDEALAYWMGPDRATFIAVGDKKILGTYYLRPNHAGGGDHIANCGYITASEARGRGVARRMCEHSLEYARSNGFKGMQFNFVVSTNKPAIHLWTSLGFEIAGRLPLAFRHPSLGYVDALVMFRAL